MFDIEYTLRRIKSSLISSSKIENYEGWRNIKELQYRNAKLIEGITSFRKTISDAVKTGLKPSNIDLLKKNFDEFNIGTEFKEGAVDLQRSAKCLCYVMNKIGSVIQEITEEKVKCEINIEERVLVKLTQYVDLEKLTMDHKKKLRKALQEVEITQKAKLAEATKKFEKQLDETITEVYNLASKEQEIAKMFSAYLEEQLEFHRAAVRTLEAALLEIRREIEYFRPKPMFGIDLTEHLHHVNKQIAVPIEQCCVLLRHIGLNEKGLFRVNGNSVKIKRIKASMNAGQINHDIINYKDDPHSVCGALKLYLRELPDPLFTNRLYSDWLEAALLDGEELRKAIEVCLSKMPATHLDNLSYIIQFLAELQLYEDQNLMDAYNLAIVFGPNLLGGTDLEDSQCGSKITEYLILNAKRFFGCDYQLVPTVKK